jgi:PAS domain S-box-containing protein
MLGMEIAPKRRPRLPPGAAQFVLGIAGLALITLVCFQTGFGLARTGFVYVILIALVSMLGSFSSSVVLSILAAACLNFFFAPPLFEFRIDAADDVLRIAAFLTASLVVTGLTARVRASEARFRSIVDHSTDGLFVFDEHQAIRDVNRHACESLGYTRAELIGMRPRDFDAGLDEAAIARIGERVKRGETVAFETLHRRKDGSVFPVEVRARQFQQGGRRLRLSVARDITERKRADQELRASEARFRTFVDYATDAFFVLDDDSTIVDVNRQACDSLGYSREELIGRHRSDLDVALDEPSIARIRQRVAAGEAVTFETRHRRKDGTSFPVEIRIGQFEQGGRRFLCLVRDITERKRAEEALRESEERFRTLVQFSFDVYWETDAQHRFTRQEFAASLADAPPLGSEIGKTRWEVPHVEPDEAAWRKHRETLDAHLPFRDFELARPTPDGGKRYVSVSGLPVFDKAGRFVGYRGVGRHITDRKRAEQALRTSEARFRSFVDHATDAFFLHDDDAAVIDVNRQACESLGYTREELIGMHPRDYNPDLDAQTIAAMMKRVRAGETVTFESLHRRKDGAVFPVEVRARQFQQGEHRFRIALVRDISERKRAEQRLLAEHTVARVLAEAATVEEATPRILEVLCEFLDFDLGTFWRIDQEAGHLCCADMWLKPPIEAPLFQAATRASKFRPGNGLPGRVWSTGLPACIPDVVQDAGFLRGSSAAREGLHAALAFPILLGGAVIGVIDFVSREVRQPDPALLDVMATIGSQIGQFIERKRAEEALRDVNTELARANRIATLGQFTASIAHEVKQPIAAARNSARAALNFLGRDPPDLQEVKEALGAIVNDADRAGHIIDRIRDQVKKAPPRKSPVDLNAAIEEVIVLARSEAAKNEISVQTRFAEALPAVEADRVQLQQVMLNLILNAVEAIRSGGDGSGELLISTERSKPHDVVVAVHDSGPGIDPKILGNLFDAFYTTKSDGVGMGLSICRSIIDAHGGRLWAEAKAPRGSVFRFTLPAA